MTNNIEKKFLQKEKKSFDKNKVFLWYCPKCKKLEYREAPPKIKNVKIDLIPIDFQTGVCLRDGHGIPFKFYKCSCGNNLGGCINLQSYANMANISINEIIQSQSYNEYFRTLIEIYNDVIKK